AGLDDAYLVAAEDVPELLDAPVGSGGAVLAVRLEMAAVYLRLVRG
ncbi:TobH protein, partial [Mycobacterium tuberculosis]|nr:TobH protein [Mycobacterium tuberculosis]